jgi:hypothetical protein
MTPSSNPTSYPTSQPTQQKDLPLSYIGLISFAAITSILYALYDYTYQKEIPRKRALSNGSLNGSSNESYNNCIAVEESNYKIDINENGDNININDNESDEIEKLISPLNKYNRQIDSLEFEYDGDEDEASLRKLFHPIKTSSMLSSSKKPSERIIHIHLKS